MITLREHILEGLKIGANTKVNTRDLENWTIKTAQDGDIVKCMGCLLFIYKGLNKDLHVSSASGSAIVYHATYLNDNRKKLDVGVDTGVGGIYEFDDYRLASEEECEEFYDALKKAGYQWDDDKKEIVKI